jgi:HlyD family secretion protein
VGLLLLLALGGWAAWHERAALSAIVSRVTEYFSGPTLPAGFASGNGRIEATEYDVATKRAGRLAAVLVREGALVEPGQVVARMDTQDLEADLRQAQAQLTQARQDKRRVVAAVAQRASELRSAAPPSPSARATSGEADAAIAQREATSSGRRRYRQRESAIAPPTPPSPSARRAGPGDEGAGARRYCMRQELIAQQGVDEALSRQEIAAAGLAHERAAKQTAEAAVVEARAQRQTAAGAVVEARAQKQAATAALDQEQARTQAADAALEAARIDVDYREAAIQAATAHIERIMADITDSTLRSPILGRVRCASPSQVSSRHGVLNLIDLSDVFMTFFLPTAAAGRVALGADIRLVLDAIPQYVIPARASFVADVAQFTPKTVETKSEREKLMFRVKAQIPVELLRQYIARVKTGLPGVAYVRLDPKAEWPAHLAVKLPP